MKKFLLILMVLLLSGCTQGELDRFISIDTKNPETKIKGCPNGGGACVQVSFQLGDESKKKKVAP